MLNCLKRYHHAIISIHSESGSSLNAFMHMVTYGINKLVDRLVKIIIMTVMTMYAPSMHTFTHPLVGFHSVLITYALCMS